MLAHDAATVEVIDLRTPNDDLVVREPMSIERHRLAHPTTTTTTTDVRFSILALFPKRNATEPDSPLMANTPSQCLDTRRTLAFNSMSIHR
jgi:hypothetical protein